MKDKNESQGCSFCIRRGFPILLARPAIMSQHDILPVMPKSIHVPVEAQGETAYTLRLLRSGYLNIWDELGHSWINYYITDGGFYYPIPENGDVPNDVASGEIKPCIDQPEELARASLITLPMMPQGTKNGTFWFAWSEVKWTDAIRKQFEEKGYREKYMQPFDMDAWLSRQQVPQALPLSQLEQTIANYHEHAIKSEIWKWTLPLDMMFNPINAVTSLVYPAYAKVTPIASGKYVENAANQGLHPKGAIFVLPDPTANVKDLSSLIEYEFNKEIYQKDKDTERKSALLASITLMKDSTITDLEREYLSNVYKAKKTKESNNVHPDAYGIIVDAPEIPEDNDIWEEVFKGMSINVKSSWSEYEKYYDANKVKEYATELNEAVKEYNSRVISPRTKMYLDWFNEDSFLDYFQCNFDRNDIISGTEFTAIISYCIRGMSDKEGTKKFFSEALIKPQDNPKNLLARALLLNQDALIKKISEAVNSHQSLSEMPWNNLIDAFGTIIDKPDSPGVSVIAVYLGILTGPLLKNLTNLLGSKSMYSFLVSMGVITKNAFIVVEMEGTFSHLYKETAKRIMQLYGDNLKMSEKSLYDLLEKDLKAKALNGEHIYTQRVQKFIICLEPMEAERIAALPSNQQLKALRAHIFSSQDAYIKNYRAWKISFENKTQSLKSATPFCLGVLSGLFQVAALISSSDLGNNKTLTRDQQESRYRFCSGVMGLSSTILSTIETGIYRFVTFENDATRKAFKNTRVSKYLFGFAGKTLGIVSAAIGAIYDSLHGVDEMMKGNLGLSSLYFLSAGAGFAIIYVLIFAPLWGPITMIISLIILLGTAIFIALDLPNNLQKWLQQCLWGKLPEKGLSKLKEFEMLKDSDVVDMFELTTYPTMQIEQDEFKAALGGF